MKQILSLSRKDGQSGFTLVELLVVIAIIGILATLVLLQLSGARAKARDTQKMAAVNQVRTAVEAYMDDNAGAPPVAATWAALCGILKPNYLSSCPDLTGLGYAYTPTKFLVSAELETRSASLDADSDTDATAYTGGNAKIDGGTEAASGASCSDATDCYYDQGN